MIDYGNVIARHAIKPGGVIHVGGYTGDEDRVYQSLGFSNRIFIEAQPDTFAALAENLSGSGAYCKNIAISDRAGTAKFYVTNNGQSSSLMKLDKHRLIYREIVETDTIEIETARLDDVMALEPFCHQHYNFLNIDIQGAELLALSGAAQTIQKMDIINLEVNFDELYQGAPHITKLDALLSAFDFVRIDTVLLHASWGDAMYVRNKLTKI